MAVISFFVWYYPIGLHRNATFTDTVHSRGFLTSLILETGFLFAGSFGQMLVAGISSEEIASSIANLVGIMCKCFHALLMLMDLANFHSSIRILRHSRWTGRSAWLLDLHVPGQSVYIPFLELTLDHAGDCTRPVCGG